MNKGIQKIDEIDGYSIYENKDKDLVEKIKAIPFDGSFVLWNKQGVFKVEKELNDKQIMCVNEEGEYEIIDKEKLEELQKDGHLLKINKTFPVHKYFIDHFGQVEMGMNKILEVTDKFDKHQTKEYSGVHYKVHSWRSWNLNDSYHYDESKDGYKNGFIFFNEDGNYKIRNYNLKLIDVDCPIISREQNINTFLSYFDKYKVLEYIEGSNYWFVGDKEVLNVWSDIDDEDAFGLQIRVEVFPHSSGNRYFKRGESYRKITKPKKGLVEVGSESIKSYLKGIIDSYQNK